MKRRKTVPVIVALAAFLVILSGLSACNLASAIPGYSDQVQAGVQATLDAAGAAAMDEPAADYAAQAEAPAPQVDAAAQLASVELAVQATVQASLNNGEAGISNTSSQPSTGSQATLVFQQTEVAAQATLTQMAKYRPPEYYPLEDCAPSHVYIGDMVYIKEGIPNLFIREDPDVAADDNIIGYMWQGDIAQIIDGPECSWGYIMWKVEKTNNHKIGWISESKGEGFWIDYVEEE